MILRRKRWLLYNLLNIPVKSSSLVWLNDLERNWHYLLLFLPNDHLWSLMLCRLVMRWQIIVLRFDGELPCCYFNTQNSHPGSPLRPALNPLPTVGKTKPQTFIDGTAVVFHQDAISLKQCEELFHSVFTGQLIDIPSVLKTSQRKASCQVKNAFIHFVSSTFTKMQQLMSCSWETVCIV